MIAQRLRWYLNQSGQPYEVRIRLESEPRDGA